MLVAATNARRKWEAVKKKVNENAYDISSIKKFLEVLHCSHAKQQQRNIQNMCAACAKLFFCYLDLLSFFTVLQRCLRRLALHNFIFCLNKLLILLRASLLALAKSIYYSLKGRQKDVSSVAILWHLQPRKWINRWKQQEERIRRPDTVWLFKWKEVNRILKEYIFIYSSVSFSFFCRRVKSTKWP